MKMLVKVAILTAAALFLLKMTSPYFGINNQLVGKPAPDFTLELVSGQNTSMSQLRADFPAILFFWATWCPHCRTQLREMTAHSEEFAKEGIKIILVDVGEPKQKVAQYLKTNKVVYDSFLDQNEELPGTYKLVGVPTFFFVNKGGVIMDVRNTLPSDYLSILSGGVSP